MREREREADAAKKSHYLLVSALSVKAAPSPSTRSLLSEAREPPPFPLPSPLQTPFPPLKMEYIELLPPPGGRFII